MRLPELTPAVSRAVAAANSLAHRLGEPGVRTIHILAGLLEEEEGQATNLLLAACVDLPKVRVHLPAAEPRGDTSEVPELPLADAVREVFLSAREIAHSLSDDGSVASDVLLYTLVRDDAEVRGLLEEHGLAAAELQSRVLDVSGLAIPLDEPLQLEESLQLAEATEIIDARRVLDAAANRAREAMRVLEDYTRFCLDDALLTGELKGLRHDLQGIFEEIPGHHLLEARDTLRDVGTDIAAPGEQERNSLRDVVQANCKRLEESLRSLEEFGKMVGGTIGQRIEELRYRSYTLERALVLGGRAREHLSGCRLMVLLTGGECLAALDWTIAEAAAGGADIFQLREKKLPDRELLERARNVRRWTQKAGALFIVNDRPDIARLAEADGVHLGQEDMPPREARRILGPDLLIGISTHSMDQLRQAVLDGVSYAGIGPTFASATKQFDEFPGLDFVRQATAETSLPLFAIGGINRATLPGAVAAGARRIAVSHAIAQAEDPQVEARELRKFLE